MTKYLPRILVVDDVYGRAVDGGQNLERRAVCERLRLRDITPRRPGDLNADVCRDPLAEACFVRGQVPVCARQGDNVANDIEQVIQAVDAGWNDERLRPGELPWSLILVDLCFYQGRVTQASENAPGLGEGMPQSNPSDATPRNYFGLDILRAIHKAYCSSLGNSEQSVCPEQHPVTVVLSGMPRDKAILDKTEPLLARAFLSRTEATEADLDKLLKTFQLVPSESERYLGCSKAWLITLRRIRQAAQQDRDILLLGETGTGKSAIAKLIHEMSPLKRNYKQFNCAAISPSIMESELFGSVRGAFTGSVDRRGYFEAAHGGTLFIDEVGEMPQEMQVKLLSVLEDRKVTPVGSTGEKEVDVRLITASNKDLEEEAREKRFRPDLFFRISPQIIRVPPLRERIGDIPLLAKAFAKTAKGPGSEAPLDDTAIRKLQSYPWPGNVRELRACIERALSEFPEVSCLRAEHIALPRNARDGRSVVPVRSSETSKVPTGSVEESPRHLSAKSYTTSMGAPSTQAESAVAPGDDHTDRSRLDGALYRVGWSLAEILHDAFEATRNRTPKNREGYSVARAMNLIYGGNVPASGPEAGRRFDRICKIVEEMAPGALDGHKVPYGRKTGK